MGTDEITVNAGGLCLANEKIGHGNGFGFKRHADSIELHVRKWCSMSDLEKKLLDSEDLMTSLGVVRVDSIDEQPFQNGLLFGNAFDKIPFKCPASVNAEDITGLSMHHESKIPKVQEDKHLSEHHRYCASERENSLCKEAENVVYDMRCEAINSKEFFLEPVAIPEREGNNSSSNSNEAIVSVAAAVADWSSVSLGTIIRSNFLSAEHSYGNCS